MADCSNNGSVIGGSRFRFGQWISPIVSSVSSPHICSPRSIMSYAIESKEKVINQILEIQKKVQFVSLLLIVNKQIYNSKLGCTTHQSSYL